MPYLVAKDLLFYFSYFRREKSTFRAMLPMKLLFFLTSIAVRGVLDRGLIARLYRPKLRGEVLETEISSA